MRMAILVRWKRKEKRMRRIRRVGVVKRVGRVLEMRSENGE